MARRRKEWREKFSEMAILLNEFSFGNFSAIIKCQLIAKIIDRTEAVVVRMGIVKIISKWLTN